MAALRTIAKEYADEIRDGIAWVIIWKTGRSWHAEAVWLNCDDDTFELEDLDTAREVLAQDPNAVMVNGYYCGHFGEDMTVAELADGILWHYENHCNLLENSTAFPPEPMERPADLPADIPWYGKATTADPDPYVYDGYMSPEDYDHMHELMQQEEKPPDDTELAASQMAEQLATAAQCIKTGSNEQRKRSETSPLRQWRQSRKLQQRLAKSRTASWTRFSTKRTITRSGGTYTSTPRRHEPVKNTDGVLCSSSPRNWPPPRSRR